MPSLAVDNPLVPVRKSTIPLPHNKRNVLSHSHGININIQAALTSISNGNLTDIKQNLLTIQEHFKQVEQYIGVTIEPQYYNEHRQPNSTTAEKVFAIPELLEAILLESQIADIMRCYGVSRTFRDTIEGSQKLQIKLFLKPSSIAAEERQNHPLSTETFNIHQPNPSRNLYATISDEPGFDYGPIPRIGSRWKRMLVSQPPIYFVTCSIDCICTAGQHGWGWRSDEGITIGDVCESARRLLDRQHACERRRIVHFDVLRIDP